MNYPGAKPDRQAPGGAAPAATTEVIPVLNMDEIMEGRREIYLRFRDSRYRLQITGSGKLLLTK